MLTLVHYGELFLKGKNRRSFEEKLKGNISRAVGGSVKVLDGRMVVEGGSPELLRTVPGVAWFARAFVVHKDVDEICGAVLGLIEPKVSGGPSFGVFVKRADKMFRPGSMELAKTVGEKVVRQYGLSVNLKNPDLPIYIEIAERCYIHFERINGVGGLPVGSSGQVLCLLSGGIDSPVSAYSMMKRGCRVDFIHFHAFSSNEQIEGSKIIRLVESLNRFQCSSKLFVVPYFPFQLGLLTAGIGAGYEMVLFRRFMVRLSQMVAQERGHGALVTGDSLGQVASQTIENITAVYEVSRIPMLQPLISFNKTEIVELSKVIGAYETSIEPYKDCCSIIVAHPKTKAKPEVVRAIEKKLDIESVLEQTLARVTTLELGTGTDHGERKSSGSVS